MTAPAVSKDPATKLFVTPAREAMFKLVVVGYAAASEWVERVRELIPPERRGGFQPPMDNDGWRMTVFDFRDEAVTAQGHAVRVYLFGHDGVGFIGQPGRAKDVVYKNAHALLGLADSGQSSQLASVLGADLQRMASSGHQPVAVLCSPGVAAPLDSLLTPLDHDFRAEPLAPLRLVLDRVLARVS
ncbi:MAG: hypothetical protein KF718_01800 [Polyangiaceae bacterium]|nr:hypothetical protein [Polyangiaceae bacterium]